MSHQDLARRVIGDEARALEQLATQLDTSFDQAVQTLLNAKQVVVSGLGKSGNIAQKMAATFTSTGTPAVYMHPVEALHGDLGIVSSEHALIAMSRSGNTEEVVRFVNHFRRLGGSVVVMTQVKESRLNELATCALTLPEVPEACPFNLAPTTSCVLMLAMGDALAMALLDARGFTADDFARYHPEGSLGRRLLLRAADLMHAGAGLPAVTADAHFHELLLAMTEKQLGLAIVTESDGRLLGTVTDGDLRRLLQRAEDGLQKLTARDVHQRTRRSSAAPQVHASTVTPDIPAVECMQIMRESRITALVVVDEADLPIGILRLMDLIEAGLG
jgi:arabinose-5-phosphate isomerase